MNRKDVEELLKDNIEEAIRTKDALDEFSEEFQQWNNAIRRTVQKFLESNGKINLSAIPPTPAASLRVRRRLSTIGESQGDELQSSKRPEPDLKKENKSNLKTSQGHHLKRAKLSFQDDTGDNGCENTGINNSQTVSPVILKVSTSKSVQESSNIEDESENCKGSKKGRRGKSKKSIIVGRKLRSTDVRRTTRSNVRITPEVLCDENTVTNDSQSVSPVILRVSSTRSVQENDIEESESRRERRRGSKRERPKRSSIVGGKLRATNVRNTRSTRITRNSSHEVGKDKGLVNLEQDLLNIVSQTSNSESVQESDDCKQEWTSSNGHRKNQNTSRATVNNHDQNSLNVSAISQTSILKSLNENSDEVRMGESCSSSSRDSDRKSPKKSLKAFNDVSKDLLNVISETSSTNPVQDISNKIIKDVSSNCGVEARNSITPKNSRASSTCKELVVCLTRIDASFAKSLGSKVTEDVQEASTVNATPKGESEGTEKKSLQTECTVETRKRSLSCTEKLNPSKKSFLDKDAQAIMEVKISDVKVTNYATSQGPHNSNKSCGTSSSVRVLENKETNVCEYREVKSFGEITLPSSETSTAINNVFEEDHEGKNLSNDTVDSGKGHSERDVERSEYYSLVDTGETAQDGKEDNSQETPVCHGEMEPRSSLRRKEEPSCDVPERATITPYKTVSHKGAKSPALFSVYANEPVKKRAAAYETLSTLVEETVPVTAKRVTRTKTRAMAAAAAAAAAAASATDDAIQKKTQMNSSTKGRPTLKILRASWRIKKKFAASAKRDDAYKENSFQLNSSKSSVVEKHSSMLGGKILADVNGLFSPVLNTSRKTPMTGPKVIGVNTSASQVNKSAYRPGVIMCNVDTFIKKPKGVELNADKKKLEQKKREEKEKEVQRRKEELLRRQAEEKKRKRDEMRQRVQEKREAQEKEKQECQLRVGKEKDEKWQILQQEREAKQKGNILKKKLETERKAAEARRKLEEAEAARIAKLKMEEEQHKREQEEAERERLKRIAEEKEATLLREKTEQKAREVAKAARERAEMQKNAVPQVKVVKIVDINSTNPLNSTFIVPTTKTTVVKHTKALNNAYNLEDLQSEESDDESNLPKKTACWASKRELLLSSKRETQLSKLAIRAFGICEITNIGQIFPKKAFKRTSSAIWNTPPRYSVLPKY